MAKNNTTGSRARNTVQSQFGGFRSARNDRGGNVLRGRLRLLFIASPKASLFTSLLATYRPPSCIPLSSLNFLAFRRKRTVARVSRSTNTTMGKYAPKVTTHHQRPRHCHVINRLNVLIWNHWIQRHPNRGFASTQEKMTGARPGPRVTQNVKIDIGRPRLRGSALGYVVLKI